MDDSIAAEERAYWVDQVRQRSADVDAARARGDGAHLIAGAELRLREAEDRLKAMPT